jgi:hypothetical protein
MKERDSDILGWVWGQRKMSQVLGVFGLWVAPCYGPFSLGAHVETSERSISLIFQFFLGHGKLQITESADTEARLYFEIIGS